MAIESTAINDLVAGLQQKPLPRETNDWLFGERDDATEIDPRAGEIPSLPRPYAQGSVRGASLPTMASMNLPVLPALDDPFARHRTPTTHVRLTDWLGIAKKLALPIAVLSIVIVVMGVYFAVTDDAPAQAATNVASPTQAEPTRVEPEQVAAAPAVVIVPVMEPEVQASAEQAMPEPNVEPSIEATANQKAEPKIEMKVVAVEVAPLPPKAEEPVAPPKADVAAAPSKAAVAAVPAAPEVAAAPKVEEQLNVAPGSPASRFLAPAPVETTIKPAGAKPAPAPTAVADWAAPSIAQTAAKPVTRQAAKKSPRAVRADTRAAAKRPAQASVAAKARAKKQVAAADDDDSQDAPTNVAGKGILSIASTPSMEVWVDGRNSNAMTPVRIKLLAGTHKVTLFDKQRAKAKSFAIQIKPDETTKVTKNYQ